MQITPKTFKNVIEFVNLSTVNSLMDDPLKPFTEGAVADVAFDQVKAVYPLIHAIHSDRMTKNFTFYPHKTIAGKENVNPSEVTGYRSFVKPTGKPILREHRAQDGFLSAEADVPMGRVIYSGMKKYTSKEMTQTPHSKKGWEGAGTIEGSGYLVLVPAIVDEAAIPRVLGGVYHTVSIGSSVNSVIESISGKDLAAMARTGNYDDMPDYRKGQLYKCSDGKERISYWIMGDMHGNECSYVNVPADDTARNAITDLGTEGVQKLMVGEKKPGAKEYSLYDAKTGEKLETWIPDEGIFDESFTFVDSLSVGSNNWWTNTPKTESDASGKVNVTESHEAISNSVQEVLRTMEIKKNILECLKNPEMLEAVTEKLEGEALETFKSTLSTIVDEKLTAKFAPERLAAISALGSGDGLSAELSNQELFTTCQEVAVNYLGDWNEAAAKLATSLYIEKDGAFAWADEKNKPVTFGELYSLESTHELFAKESNVSREELEAINTSINVEAVALEARLYDKKLEEFPLIQSAGVTVEAVTSIADCDEKIALVDTIAEAWNLSEDQKTQMVSYLEEVKKAFAILNTEKLSELPLVEYKEGSAPVEIPAGSLIEMFLNRDKSESHLLPLLSICRTKKISKQEISEAVKAYEHFSPKVQKILLDKLPDAPVAVEDAKPEEPPVLEGVVNPVAEAADESNVPTTKDTARTETWKKLAQKPLRPSPKVRAQKETK